MPHTVTSDSSSIIKRTPNNITCRQERHEIYFYNDGKPIFKALIWINIGYDSLIKITHYLPTGHREILVFEIKNADSVTNYMPLVGLMSERFIKHNKITEEDMRHLEYYIQNHVEYQNMQEIEFRLKEHYKLRG